MTVYKALNRRDNWDRLYMSRKEWVRRIASIEDSVNSSIQRIEDCIKKHRGRLVTNTRNTTGNTSTNRTKITKNLKKGKKSNSMDISKSKQAISLTTWTWLRKRNLKRETEYLLIAVQNNAIMNNDVNQG